MRLMIVEDHVGIRKKICELLARPNVEMYECGAGEQAMWSAHDFQPDWIIMDVHLPGVNGFEATEAIRRELRSVRFVIISAEDRDYLRHQALAVGAEQFLSKHDLAQLPRMLYGESPQPLGHAS
jgi:CheY-like chemotaxis protein